MLKRAHNTRTNVSRTETFPAPSGGWVQSGNITMASPQAAEVLDNFIPTAQGARMRGGAAEHANIGASVVRMFSYASGAATDFFAATASKIFDVDRIAGGGSNAFGDVEGLTSGDWSAVQISTAGGQFLVAVNGSDYAHYWDGADFNPIAGVALNDLGFDAETAAFTVGSTLTGGTSGATATILGITKTSATAGTLRLGAITGTFQNDETITDAATGSATANGTASAGSTIAITGVDTSTLSQVWNFKERLFFVEGNTPSFWYLQTESIGGAATEFNLGSVFGRGGSLLFGATWSLDSGSGLDDVCIFVSDQGEVAVYEGTDPSSVSTWSLVGVYDLGRPVNKHGHFKAGGDLAVLTDDGIIPMSEALKKDRAALQSVAVSYPIEDAWKDAIANRTTSYPISVSLWQSQTLLLVGTPAKDGQKNVSFAANARTGAWARFTGWDVRCSAVVADQLYFGSDNGKIYQADVGGTDDGSSYAAIYVGKFSPSDNLRSANAVGVTYRAVSEVNIFLDVMSDYNVGDVPIPQPIVQEVYATWGAGVWGTFVWGDTGRKITVTEWQSAYANGYSLAPVVALNSNATPKPIVEILMTRVRSETGYSL